MSCSKITSAAISGMGVELLEVEADVSAGLPGFHMVGYLSSEVREASERVRTAIHNAGIILPARKIVINISPVMMKKRGSSYDLAIALAILSAIGELQLTENKRFLAVGELSLAGEVHKVRGILPIMIAAKEAGIEYCIVPEENVPEASLVGNLHIIGVRTLQDANEFIRTGKQKGTSCNLQAADENAVSAPGLDFKDVNGQYAAKRAAEVAAAGGHNLLIIGPPGSGKTMIASRMSGILPELTYEESMELTKIYSIKGLLNERSPLIHERPFRSVTHTATRAALLGGGSSPGPGEISLAHKGILFMDELPEFPRELIDSLRLPLEERKVRINRACGSYQFPAEFMLVGAMNVGCS